MSLKDDLFSSQKEPSYALSFAKQECESPRPLDRQQVGLTFKKPQFAVIHFKGGDMDRIYLLIDGIPDGPYSEDEVLRAVGLGLISDDLLAWHRRLADWIPVGRLIGLLLALQSAPPEKIDIALKSEATANPQIDDLQAKVLKLSLACPYDQSNPRTCPLHEVRKISWKEKCRWIDELSETSLRDLLIFHQKCLAKKMKTLEKVICGPLRARESQKG
ncbi:MAG: DUF4339 domain-containing protein [Methylacidiphilales bacterium]|nr:DUF4339 domain-containing protein [Candidatus Methylacidiphilales bacterium]